MFKSYLIKIITILISVFVALYIRMWWSSTQEWQKGQEEEKAGHYLEALEHYQYAMRLYAPGLNSNQQAAQKLWILGEEKYQNKQDQEALQAFDRLRGGILATRSFYMPYAEMLNVCNERIAVLRARAQLLWDRNNDFEALKKEHLSLLNQIPGPSPLGSLIISFSFGLWVLFAILSILKDFDENLKLIRMRYLSLSLGFALIWTFSLYLF